MQKLEATDSRLGSRSRPLPVELATNSSPRFHIEVVGTSPDRPEWAEPIFKALSKYLPQPLAMRDIRSEQEELELIGLADVVAVAGRDMSALCGIVATMRKAHLVMPIVALVEAYDSSGNATLLNAGFDDVFHRDMHPAEITARAEALHARRRPSIQQRKARNHLTRPGQDERIFTPREGAVVKLLQEKEGRLLTYGEIFDRLGSRNDARSVKSLRVAISNIRNKIPEAWTISSVGGMGYVLLQKPVATAA